MRTFLRSSAVAVLTSTLAAASCGDRSTGTGGASSSASTAASSTGGGGASAGSLAADYCEPLAALVCGRAKACGCGAVLPSGQLDEAACVAGYARRCLDAYAPLASVIAQGQGRVLAAAAHACVELLASSSPGCERPRGGVAQALCPTWFTGAAAIGEACDVPICADTTGVCVAGQCAARPAAGQPCAGQLCAEGVLCVDGTCAAPAAVGAACSSDDACAPPLRCVGGACQALGPAMSPCASSEACALGLVCASGACAAQPSMKCSDTSPCGNLAVCALPRRCLPKGGAGAGCVGDDSCADGFACDPATQACAPSPGLGLPCANGISCAVGLACDLALGNCAPIPQQGEPCALGLLGPFVCAAGLGCLGATCDALPGDGQPCTLDSRCAAGLGCDSTAQGSLCGPLKDVGDACQTDRSCKLGLHCDFTVNTCAAAQPAGTPCKEGNECGPAGSCLTGSGGQLVCAPLPGPDQGCNFDCTAGLYCGAPAAEAFCVPEICKEL